MVEEKKIEKDVVVAMEGRLCVPLCRLRMDPRSGQYAGWVDYIENRPNKIFEINPWVSFMEHQVVGIRDMMSDRVRVHNLNRYLCADQPWCW